MVDLIKNTNFSIQFVLDKINANEPRKQPEEEEQQHPQLETDQGSGEATNQLEGFEAKDITNGRAFLSTIMRLSLRWKQPKRSDLPTSIIMKVPGPQHRKLFAGHEEDGMEEVDKEATDYLIMAHTREIRFYECFSRLGSGLRLPKFYFGSDYHPSHQEGIILMEDLTGQATTTPVLPGFTDAQVLAVLTEVARLHATSWRHPEWEEKVGIEVDRISQGFIDEMRGNADKLTEIDPAFGPLVARLRPMFTADNCSMSCYSGSKYGFPASIVHGDLWSANVLWEWNEQRDGPTERLCAIIDWQTVHPGNCCEDISRLLSLNTGGQYRRQNTQRMLEFYAQKVAEFMGGEGNVPFTMDQLKDAYKHSLPFSMMYFCFGVPFYHEMDSVIGKSADGREQREENQRELLDRCRMFLEDTAEAFGL